MLGSTWIVYGTQESETANSLIRGGYQLSADETPDYRWLISALRDTVNSEYGSGSWERSSIKDYKLVRLNSGQHAAMFTVHVDQKAMRTYYLLKEAGISRNKSILLASVTVLGAGLIIWKVRK